MIRIRTGYSHLGQKEPQTLIEDVRNGRIVNQMAQTPLPPRRPGITVDLFWPPQSDNRYHVCVGMFPDTGRPAEVFAKGPRSGSEMDALLDDCCIAISKLIQSGADPHELAQTFTAQSLMGAVAAIVAAEAP